MDMQAGFFTTQTVKYVLQFCIAYNRTFFHYAVLIIICKDIVKSEMALKTRTCSQYVIETTQKVWNS